MSVCMFYKNILLVYTYTIYLCIVLLKILKKSLSALTFNT